METLILLSQHNETEAFKRSLLQLVRLTLIKNAHSRKELRIISINLNTEVFQLLGTVIGPLFFAGNQRRGPGKRKRV
jgi:hypothetical protein